MAFERSMGDDEHDDLGFEESEPSGAHDETDEEGEEHELNISERPSSFAPPPPPPLKAKPAAKKKAAKPKRKAAPKKKKAAKKAKKAKKSAPKRKAAKKSKRRR